MTSDPKANAVQGSDLIVDTLIRLGAKHAFNVIGLGMYELGAAFHRRRGEIGYIGHVNETNLALMAQGYARQTRKPAFCLVYYSSGTGLALISLVTAWADHAPLVVISSTNSRLSGGRDQYAATPRSVLEMGAQFAKWSFEVPTAERLPEALARAYAIAAEPPMGPVHLAVPSDLFGAPVLGSIPRLDFDRTRRFVEDCADEQGLAEIADLLCAAAAPVLMAGSEVGQLGAVDALVELAQALGAPVMIEDQPSYMSFPTSHPQYVGSIRANAALLGRSDAALAIGVEFTEIGRAGERPYFPAPIKLAHLSVDRVHTTKQLWPDIALSGHPRPSLTRLTALVRDRGLSEDAHHKRLAVCAARRARRRQEAEAIRGQDRDQSPVPPGLVIEEIRQACGQDWIIVQSGTTAGNDFDVVYEMDHPDDFHALSGKGSAQGWGAPVATGVQLAASGRRVMAFVGDGNLMFTATSILAAAKEKLPMVFVIANNDGWSHVGGAMLGMAQTRLEPEELARMGWSFGQAPIDYVGFARSLGLQAAHAATAIELQARLAQAVASDQPWLIEVATGLASAPIQDRAPPKD